MEPFLFLVVGLGASRFTGFVLVGKKWSKKCDKALRFWLNGQIFFVVKRPQICGGVVIQPRLQRVAGTAQLLIISLYYGRLHVLGGDTPKRYGSCCIACR